MDWKLFKITYPYICDKCGFLHWEKKTRCEGCGSINTLRITSKKDWKNHYLLGKPELKAASI